MRFDDMLATVLARAPDRPGAVAAQWRQLVDLLAQYRGGNGAEPLTTAAVERLDALRAAVPRDVRRAAAAAVAPMPLGADLVAFLAADVPVVAGALIGTVSLSDTEWLDVIPRLGPSGRALLRHRRDLRPAAVAALNAYGASDLLLADGTDGNAPALPAREAWAENAEPIAPPLAAAPAVSHIRPRIEAEGAAVEMVGEATTVDGARDETIAPLRNGRVVSLFGAVDGEEQQELPLAGGEEALEPFNPDGGRGQIRSIISRIARFRSGEETAPAPRSEPLTRFAFETDATGIVRFVDAEPRGALVGQSIAHGASGAFGVDGSAAGAFRKRAPFRSARLVVMGESALSGEWRIAGVPVFAPANGRFLGYRCTARRPLADERAGPVQATQDDDARRGDTLRQVVHELRTPLNAIGGFAEMIRRQMRGPVASPYRERARDIADQAGRLMTAVDDLDVAARLDALRLDLQRIAVPLAPLLAPVCGEQADAARARGLAFDAALPLDLPAALGDGAAIRRMVARLLASALALAEPDERIRLSGEQRGAEVVLHVARPRRLAGIAEGQLFDPSWCPDDVAPDAPLLGLGFSLHLVRRLAAASGAALLVEDDRFTLRLPVADAAEAAVLAGS